MAGILVENVSKSYLTNNGQGKFALQNISLTVQDGEFICLLGPSGCGKTTLLNILSGLEQDYQGTVRFTRKAGDSATAKHRPAMSYMFQEPRLLPWLTVKENIRFVTDKEHSSRETLEHIDLWLERVGLTGYGNYYPMQLSTGMQQRVSVARALILNPELLFMDEPFSSLDELTALRMREELLELWMDQGCTVVFVTHNPLEAVFLADRLVIMSPSPGRITAEIIVKDLLPRPRDGDDQRVWELSRQAVRHLRGIEPDSMFGERVQG